MKNNLSIAKWYMDSIDAEGNTFIGYSAILKWGKLSLNYSSQLVYINENGLEEKSSLRKVKFPDYKEDTLNWKVSYTNSKGKWKSIEPCIENQLLTSEKGNIEWFCAQPRAKAEVTTLKKTIINGLGYTEKLVMTIKPWELPINKLYWGRFLSDTHSLIWIKWMGTKPLNQIYLNGMLIKDAEISDFKISSKSQNLELILTNPVTLREGSLKATALSKFPRLAKIFPDKIMTTFECKWRSNGILTINNLKTSPGWAIHEIVKWN